MLDRREAVRVFAVAAAAILGLPWTLTSARAQEKPLAQVLPDLVLREIVLQRGAAGPPHQAHFSPLTNELRNPVVGIVQGFNGQMATQFATFPLGSSAGGLTYEFDPTVGTLKRGSAGFGPLFAERALTIGRRKLSAGFNYQRTSYDTFEGQSLDDGSIKFYLRHQDCCGFTDPTTFSGFMTLPDGTRLSPPFEGDLIEAALSLKATTHTTAVFANYGLTDRWDVGLAVPFVRVNLEARVTARILRLVTEVAPDTHTFETGNPNATQTVQHSGHASGLGDVVVRTKYRFLRKAGGGLAAAFDLRLPTGNENELLGAGGVQAKFLLVASNERGRFGQHVNVGYTVAQGRVGGAFGGLTSAALPDELNYSAGAEFVVSPRLTVIGDVVGRTLRGAGRLGLVNKSFEYAIFPDPPQPAARCYGQPGVVCTSISLKEFAPRSSDLRLLLGTGGVKYNLAGNLLVSASVLFPLTNAGLRSRATTMIGMDYVF